MRKYLKADSQKGFTVIELMVALALGLILVAAAIQLFTGGILSSQLQRANAEIQDSGIFGLDSMLRDVRLANVGNLTNLKIDDQTPYGGIVLTGSSAANALTVNFVPTVAANTYIDAALLSRGSGDAVSTTDNHWKGLSNVTDPSGTAITSDQLTVQFVAPAEMSNCEGKTVFKGDLIVQRYYLRVDKNGTDDKDLALACDANTPAATEAAVSSRPTTVSGLGTAGQVIIPRVDHFHVLLKVKADSGELAYYTIPEYRAAAQAARDTPASEGTVDEPRILAVQISTLIRSTNNAKNPVVDPAGTTYSMFDHNVKASDTTTRYLRRVYSSTVALRNAMGEDL
ncbi:PilW family protein [Acinetobacter chinensis]|uniref:PilW family protein n=1 Tax=Acinetobacter chinensis TaxID=2004650 RepID=A0ABU3WG16_9GAMM|nr:PilW family protein [Acinetobacter chinensis]MDV2469345.1 PilW family protein [Acinetobacter chinensis]